MRIHFSARRLANTPKSKLFIEYGVVLTFCGILLVAYLLFLEEICGGFTYLMTYDSRMAVFWYSVAAVYVLAVLGFYIYGFHCRKKEREVVNGLRGLTAGGASANDFLAMRGALRKTDFTGIYVLHNKTKDLYYVGQSIKVIDRVGQHFTGHGNGDVYADFKYGDEFEVSTLSLVDSGYGSLNDLERDTIATYDAYDHGYNRTAGNAR